MSKRGRKARRRSVAEDLREQLPKIGGLSANPCELEITIEIDKIDSYKYLDCPNYDDCVNIASMASWRALTCRACAIFKALSPGKEVRKVRKVDEKGS